MIPTNLRIPDYSRPDPSERTAQPKPMRGSLILKREADGAEALKIERVEPGDDFCRTCHEEALREQTERIARIIHGLKAEGLFTRPRKRPKKDA